MIKLKNIKYKIQMINNFKKMYKKILKIQKNQQKIKCLISKFWINLLKVLFFKNNIINYKKNYKMVNKNTIRIIMIKMILIQAKL